MNSTSHIGAAGEMSVCTYFLSQGLEVFRNVAASGPVDLIVYNKETDKTVLVDVKSHQFITYRVDGTLTPTYCPKWINDVAIVKYIHGEGSVSVPEGFWGALGMETAECP